MAPPEEVRRGLGVAMRRMAEEFPLEVVVAGKGAKREADDNKGEPEKKKVKTEEEAIAGPSGESPVVTEVGSSSPVRDFETLLRSGQSLVATAQQLEQVVEDLVRVSYGTQGRYSIEKATCTNFSDSCSGFRGTLVVSAWVWLGLG